MRLLDTFAGIGVFSRGLHHRKNELMGQLNQKIEWIREWQRSRNEPGVDVLFVDFVEDYCDAFGEKEVKNIGRVMSFAYRAGGECDRWVKRLGASAQWGSPYWVYAYDFVSIKK